MYLLLAKITAGVRARWRLTHAHPGTEATQESGGPDSSTGGVIAIVLQ